MALDRLSAAQTPMPMLRKAPDMVTTMSPVEPVGTSAM
jgi:hypothetical protein